MARLQLRQILFPVPEGVQDHFDGAGRAPAFLTLTREKAVQRRIKKMESPALENPKVESLNWTVKPPAVRPI